jgi:hypothetical protein
MKPRRQNPQLAGSCSRNTRLAHNLAASEIGLDARRVASPHRGAGEFFFLTSPLIGCLGEVRAGEQPNRKYRLAHRVAETSAIPTNNAICFCNAGTRENTGGGVSLHRRSFAQNADRAMALYSLRSQRFHRLSFSCAYRRPEGSHQQGRQQDQQGCKVKPQIIRLHPVQLTA